ncbi:MAG: FliA/WhiG family RNA polymerase sigma factor [Lachnospiraceae bacterium]|nr:FliA/WhiG family RNA polymerase sigma factor [Lachnospiraceae bacterium]
MDEVARANLWKDYARLGTADLREKLILEYAPLVKVVAGRLSMYLGYNVEYDDLVGYGIFGLIDAIDKYDHTKQNKFETYASLRIRGEILDQIRKMDWIPRTVRQKQKQIDAAMKEFEAEHGRQATDEELATALGISSDEFIDWQTQLNVTNVISLNEFMESGSDVPNGRGGSSHYMQPDEAYEEEELKQVLAQSLEILTEKERRVIELYYYEELTLKEIALVLEVSESRVSQLHTKALSRMKTKMGKYMGILADNV